MFFKMFFGGRGVISTNSECTRTPSHKEIQRIAWEDGKNSGKLTGTQRTLVLPHVNFSGESVGAPVALGSAFSPLAGRACRAAVQTGCLQSQTAYERKESTTRIGSKRKKSNILVNSNKEKEAEQEQAQTQAQQILCIEQSPPAHYFLSINPPLINQTPLSRAKQRR